ncbi:MAG: protein kinase [Lentisphaeraceae bacterium]|nr:protein kinase [Lentisphaeraceae bacterium]
MEMAYYCKQCGSANLIDYSNSKFVGSCFNCAQPIHVETDSLCVNTIIGERYQIRELLEETNISNLYVASDLATGSLVILRVFCWDFSYSITEPEDFLNTVDSVSSIATPTHVELIDWGVNEDLMFTIWPCDSVETLTKLLKNHQNFEPTVALSICRDIAIALEKIYFETGVGHYNLSADNIYLDSHGEARFSDSGHAAYLFYDEHFQDAEFNIFNMHYVSPEVAFNWSFPDIKSDMYSLGCCLYAMVTGKLPFGHRGPQSENDYSQFSFTKPDEFRLGDTFVGIFYGLTEVNPSERFENWRDVIKLMDKYLYEENMMRKSSLSGKRRMLTTSYNFDVYADIDENLARPARARKRKKKKKVLSTSDIRVKMRSEAPVSNVRYRSTKAVNAKSKHAGGQTMLIVTCVIVSLGILLFALMASKLSSQESVVADSKTAKVDSGSIKEATPKKVPSKSVKQKKTIDKTPEDSGSIALTQEDKFKELTFEVREFTIRKDWDQALVLCRAYSGKYQNQVDALISEIEKKKVLYLENKLNNIATEDKSETSEVMAGSSKLADIAEKVFKKQFNVALQIVPVVEELEKLDLTMEKEALEDLDPIRLNSVLAKSYEADKGNPINVTVDGVDYEGTVLQVSSVNGSLRMSVNYLSRKLERIYSFNSINPLDNLKRIKYTNKSKESLVRFMFLINNDLHSDAEKYLDDYQGPLKKSLTLALKNIQNSYASQSWQELLDFVGLTYNADPEKFVDSFKLVKLVGGDPWLAKWYFERFMKNYALSSYYEENKTSVSLLHRFLLKLTEKSKHPDLLVSDNGAKGTVSLEAAINNVKEGGLIRILPGAYPGNIIIRKKLHLVGASGVRFTGNVSIDEDRVVLQHINFINGYLELHRGVRDVIVSWLSFKSSGIMMRGDNSNVSIIDTITKGLILGDCRQVNIKDSIILDSSLGDIQNKYAISGFVSGSISNSIIFSQNGFAMKFTERKDSTMNLKYCLIFGRQGLAHIRKDNLIINDLGEFNRRVGRIQNSELVMPVFRSQLEGDYRLKDFTPGFFTGENKKAIGVQFNYQK